MGHRRCNMQLLITLIFTFSIVFLTKQTHGHEVWLEPTEFRAGKSVPIVADVKIGANFKGEALPYLPSETVLGGIADRGGKRPLKGFVGDIPAINQRVTVAGLQVLFYETKPEIMTFEKAEKFRKYLGEKGLDAIWKTHLSRGLSEENFSEAYSRSAKALLMRGKSLITRGKDIPTGLTLEWVAEDNPFLLRPRDQIYLTARLLWKGQPLPNAPTTIFHRSTDATVEVGRLFTDQNGKVQVPIDNEGLYMMDTVHMIPTSGSDGAVWRSFWSTLTFEIDGVDAR